MIYCDPKYFDPEKIYLSGQVLLGWKRRPEGGFLVRSLDKNATVMRITEGPEENIGRILISCPDSDNPFWSNYFDLQTDYAALEKKALKPGGEDDFLSAALEYGRGIRMLRQNTWEALCSFIVSQNNNIPRITKSIEKIEEGLGHFPDPEELYERRGGLADCGLGYRDEYLKLLAEDIHDGRRSLDFPDDTDKAYAQLTDIRGVGPKVANCVLLFGLHRMERCPVDTWMKKVFENHYGGKAPDWTKSEYAGYYQQVTFFYERNRKTEG